MTSAQLLEALRQRGARLFLANGRLRYKTTRGKLPADLQALIQEHGAELLALLQTPAAPPQDQGEISQPSGIPCPSGCRCSEVDALWAEDAAMLVLIAWFREEPGTRPTPWSLDEGRVIEEQDRWPFLFALWDEVCLGGAHTVGRAPAAPGPGSSKRP